MIKVLESNPAEPNTKLYLYTMIHNYSQHIVLCQINNFGANVMLYLVYHKILTSYTISDSTGSLTQYVMFHCIESIGKISEKSSMKSPISKAFDILLTKTINAKFGECISLKPNWNECKISCLLMNDSRYGYIRPSNIFEKRGSTETGL